MRTWNKFYEKKNGNRFPDVNLIRFFNKNFIKIKKNIDILDLGCGTGSTLMLTNNLSCNIDFVDISKNALKKIKNNNKKNKIKLFNKSFNDFLKFSKKKYDLIIDNASLQHQTEDEFKESLTLIGKKLKKKGFFFSINLNSDLGINDNNYKFLKMSKNKLLELFKLCKLNNVNYNYYYYTEDNCKKYIKFNVITGQKLFYENSRN